MKHFALFFKYYTCRLSKKNPKGISHIYIYICIFLHTIIYIYIYVGVYENGGTLLEALFEGLYCIWG